MLKTSSASRPVGCGSRRHLGETPYALSLTHGSSDQTRLRRVVATSRGGTPPGLVKWTGELVIYCSGMDFEFDRGIAVEPMAPGEYAAQLDGGWVVGGGLNGGYLLAVIGNAIRAELRRTTNLTRSASAPTT